MMKRTKTGLVVGAAVLAIGGIGGGVAFAAGDSGPATPLSAALTASTSGSAPSSTAPGAPGSTPKHRKHPLLRRVEHAEATLNTKQGPKVIDLQRGAVTAVSPTSVTVRSKDGYTETYAVAPTSKVRQDKKDSTISAVRTGDQVLVVGTKQGDTVTVNRLADRGPATGH
ncbi:MAG TPA: hypothetical protein VG756_25900 [Pseudonocardiaceae bacterium]|jgi:hypothetical protein|nr:hypothetical protein [Pseudonocardiaceae bacterium]